MKRFFPNIDKLWLQEKLSYTVLWLLVFSLPLIGSYYRASGLPGASFDWVEVLRSWKEYLPFLFLFIVHDWLIAPLIVHENKRLAYLGIAGCALLIFSFYIWNEKPFRQGPPPRDQIEMRDGGRPSQPPQARGDIANFDSIPMPPSDMQTGNQPPQRPDRMEGDRPNQRPERMEGDRPFQQSDRMGNPPPKPKGDDEPRELRDGEPPIIIQTKLSKVFVAILMMGVNLGIMLYFKQRRREDNLQELQHEKLQQELEYLKYQINPHFFMNTLNNIHALVDIDPEKAKSTIIELSRLMRYVLYDSARPTILLSKEIDFLKQYITLMRLRFTDKVSIEVIMPEDIPGVEVPPLLFVSFVENAFKHGVSYEQESFINVKMELEEGYLTFSCKNSKHEKKQGTNDPHSGIGLENVKKRLKLIYGNDYFFLTSDKENTYEVSLKIPVKDDKMLGH